MTINLKNMRTPPIKHHAISDINPDAEFTWADEEITWTDGNPTNITEEQIATKLAELIAEWEALDYARKREVEYPPIAEQLDKIYHEGIDKWKEDMILPVKEKYPK
tara:strand:+ start:180 stop:497 length:318 start_codon:yes stop_codon:yes gene_type:complete